MYLSSFEEKQPIAYKILTQSLTNNKLSHAYIIETNNSNDATEFINSFVKDIFCMDVDNKEIKKNISLQVDNEEYIELKRIKTKTLEIKKDQIIDLQEEFKNKPIYGTKKVYIIEDAEKLNASSSNTILKFLEEPEENIIAILVVNNRFSLMNTILSRCQLISLIEYKTDKINDLLEIDEEEYQTFYENIINFICFYEKNKKSTLLYEKREFLKYFNNRDKELKAFEFMKLFYLTVLKNKTIGKTEYFKENSEIIVEVSNNNDTSLILKKIDVIIKCIDRLNSYVNNNMLLDYFIIETSR